MTKIIVFRHGQTNPNVKLLCQGAIINEPLNEVGVAQAEELRDKLAQMDIDLIVSSPLKRAFQTASIVAEVNGLAIEILDELMEASMGILEGETMEYYRKQYPDIWDARHDFNHSNYWNAKVSGMESRREIQERAGKALKIIKERYPDKVIGVATHGFFMQNMYYHLFGKFKNDFENAEFFEFELL